MTARAVLARAALAGAVALSGCAAALHAPPPISALAPRDASGSDAGSLLRRADAAWARRADPAQLAVAESLYLQAAAADETRVDALLGAIRARIARIGVERSGKVRADLARSAVELGQWCQRRAPGNAACDYALGAALGVQARERPSTAEDGLKRMVALLRTSIAEDPRVDEAGALRVLAFVLLRAPAWPMGPGDPEAALGEARKAVALFPDHPENQLALAEALAQNAHRGEARTAYARALALATAREAAGDPDAVAWAENARKGLGR